MSTTVVQHYQHPPWVFSTKKPVVIFSGFTFFSKCHKANGNAPWCYFTRCRSGISRRGLKKPWRWWRWLMMTWMTQKKRPLRFGSSIVLNFRWQNSWSPQKNDSDFFLGFLEGVLLDELSYCSQQRFPSIKIIKHRIPDQNINMSIFSCLLVIHLAWLDGIHSPDFKVRNLWPSEKNNQIFLCLFWGALAAGFWECTWWLDIGIFHVQLHRHTKWMNSKHLIIHEGWWSNPRSMVLNWFQAFLVRVHLKAPSHPIDS